MTKQEKLLWSLLAGVLVILFLLSSTDLIIKEKKTEIYPVSVIISDTSDDYLANFRKGVDKAAEEYNVDVSFITLYEKGDARQQMELVRREINDGASAVVLIPVKPVECARELDDMVLNSPAVIVGNMFPNERVQSGIAPDYQEEGRRLGQAIAAENPRDLPVWVFSEGLDYGYNRDVYDGIFTALTEAGFTIKLYEKETDETYRQTIESMVYPGREQAIIAAIDVKSLDEAADIIAGSPVYGNYIAGLYGIGSTTKILNELDKGIIKGLVVNDQFDAGYMSIEKAVEAVHKDLGREQIVLESHYIQKAGLRESRFEKILYPID
ncbi:substrate-binding domain-containing protein [Lachnospiraceae bacterium 54-53]